MNTASANGQRGMSGWLLGLGSWLYGLWQLFFLAAQLVVLAFSPSSYRSQAGSLVLREIYRASGPPLPGFTLLMALFNVVVIRIVVVTAFSYGLTQFALDAVIRVLVLELIPLMAALYIAVAYSIPGGSQLYQLRLEGHFEAQRARGRDPLTYLVLPRVLGAAFAVILLASVSCIISLVLTYMAVHGFTTASVVSFSRAVGHVFDPGVSLIFVIKTVFFALMVAGLPAANAFQGSLRRKSKASAELRGLARMLALMLLLEVLSLIGNYY